MKMFYEALGLEYVHPVEPRPARGYKVKIQIIGYYLDVEFARDDARHLGFGSVIAAVNPEILADRKLLAGWFADNHNERDAKLLVMVEVTAEFPNKEIINKLKSKVEIIDTYPLPHSRHPKLSRRSVNLGGLGI